MAKQLLIGTSGWNYPHWKGVFYPENLSSSKWLEYYAKCFNAVELNVTFYRMVRRATFEGWYQRTPKDFYFVVKGSRFITHIKRLRAAGEALRLLLKNAGGLKEKLAAVLWQLPPSFKKNLKTLEAFCRLLKKTNTRNAFEFRHPSWFDKETYRVLKRYNCALCNAHSGRRYPCVKEITADFLYLRFHGGEALYASDYPDVELKEWAALVRQSKCRDIFAFFNNDACGYALKNAQHFRQLLK
ncbi:MAG: DUF72 domain-containing protein [Candidatus Omnitrophota bacterium]